MLVAVDNEPNKGLVNKTIFEGHIDAVVGTELVGWAYDSSRPLVPLEVQVFCENRIVGQGVADRYRGDLHDAKMGSGRHVFAIMLDASVCDGKSREVTIVEKETGVLIPTNKFKIEIETKVHGKINRIENGVVQGSFEFSISSEAVDCVASVSIDGVAYKDVHCKKQDKSNICSFQYPIPAFVFDGMPHYFEATIPGISTSFKPYIDIFNAIQTPWQYIHKSSSKNNYAQLSRTSSYRYDSLRNHLNNPKNLPVGEKTLANIVTAHDVVLEGFLDRKQFPKLSLPVVEKPNISIIVPVYNNFPITYHCIASNILAYNNTTYEVIVVDDCSTDRTTEIEDIVENLKVVRNEKNLGFLRSCNKAAEIASGEHILLLNNDTEVTSGWLDEMLLTMKIFNRVGAVGSKLIYPDGKLQEAGGIVWNNGKPWNIGNRQNSEDPKFNYARESDYLSAATLLVKRQVWVRSRWI